MKLKLNLFHNMTSVSQVLVFLLAILLQCISKDDIASCFFNIYCIYYVTCCLRTHCLSMFQIQVSTKQIPTLHNIINFVNVLSIGYFIHLLLLLLQHGDIESNLGPKNKQINNLSCCHWNVNSYWLKIYLRFSYWSLQLTL